MRCWDGAEAEWRGYEVPVASSLVRGGVVLVSSRGHCATVVPAHPRPDLSEACMVMDKRRVSNATDRNEPDYSSFSKVILYGYVT